MNVIRSLRKLILFAILFLLSPLADAQTGFVESFPRIAYWKLGSHKDIVIVIHGGPGVTHNYLRPEWDSMSQYATTIYYDQRGTGLSEKAACYSWREHVDDLNRLIEVVSPTNRVILSGSSWGVVLAGLYTHIYPDKVKGLILTGTVSWLGKGQEEKDCSEYEYHEIDPEQMRLLKQNVSLKLDSTVISRTPHLAPKESTLIQVKPIDISMKVKTETLNSLADAPSFRKLKFTVPILIFQGTEKCYFNDVSSQYASLSNYSEVVYIEESCHDPWLVNPNSFFERCGAFVDVLE